MTEEMRGAKERGDSEVREEKKGKGDGGRSWSLVVGDKRKERSERREPVLCSPVSHLTTLSALLPERQPALGFSSCVSSLRGSHAGRALEYVEKLFIQLARHHPQSF